MNQDHQTTTGIVIFLVFCLLTVSGFWLTRDDQPLHLIPLTTNPTRIMGTKCRLTAIVKRDQKKIGRQALARAEKTIRAIESQFSVHLTSSRLSHFNNSGANQWLELKPETATLFRRSQEINQYTKGAFDITCSPLVRLWKAAGKKGQLPTPEQIKAARDSSNWQLLQLEQNRAKKIKPTLAVDLGGIAKGYAIDQAIELIRKANCHGGLVDIGGDLRCFGTNASGKPWQIHIRDPHNLEATTTTIPVTDKAICTSGDYCRYTTINGRKYSHIIDPRTGYPAQKASSATIMAPTATEADGWATALSVLGPPGLELIKKQPELEAWLIFNNRQFSTLDPK